MFLFPYAIVFNHLKLWKPQPMFAFHRHLSTTRKVALVIGAGDSTGSAIARKFAREGLVVCAVRRQKDKLSGLISTIANAGGEAFAYGVDCRKEEEVVALIKQIEATIAPIDVMVFNIGANVNFKVTETTSRVYYKVWEMACFSGFLVSKAVAKVMQEREHGTIIFTGATASLRGGAGFCAFSGAKHALRALAQSMARELGPSGIHVAHVVIDGAIDTPWIHENYPLAKERSRSNGLLLPDDIAQNYYNLYVQPRNSWTHELDLRPWDESW